MNCTAVQDMELSIFRGFSSPWSHISKSAHALMQIFKCNQLLIILFHLIICICIKYLDTIENPMHCTCTAPLDFPLA